MYKKKITVPFTVGKAVPVLHQVLPYKDMLNYNHTKHPSISQHRLHWVTSHLCIFSTYG